MLFKSDIILRASVIAQAGIGDIPGFFFLLIFSIWPFHIAVATGVVGAHQQLVGYGPAAAAYQAAALVALVAAIPLIWRSQAIPVWVKCLYLPLGYPLVTFITNVLPGVLCCYIGGTG